MNKTQNAYYELIKGMVIGVLLMLGALGFWLHLAGNPFEELALIRSAQTTSGFIIDTWAEPGESFEGETRWSNSITYKYCVPNGREFMGKSKGRGRLSQELSNITEPYPVEIEYLPNKSDVSRIKGTGCQSITEFLWRKVGIGGIFLVLLLAMGFIIIRSSIVNYQCMRMVFEIEHGMENSGDLTESQIMHKVGEINRKVEKMKKSRFGEFLYPLNQTTDSLDKIEMALSIAYLRKQGVSLKGPENLESKDNQAKDEQKQ